MNTNLTSIIFALALLQIVSCEKAPPHDIEFTTQEQIDNFKSDYRGRKIEGNVCIGEYGVSSEPPIITNLNGLSELKYIGGNLTINDISNLKSLAGLENLKSIGGDLWISHNLDLNSLTGLENLTSIGGELTITHNLYLTSITGIENISASSVTGIQITDNIALISTNCSVKCICDFLDQWPDKIRIGVYGYHGSYVDQVEEVKAACGAGK
jgi:hypothetical protein